MTDKEKLEAIKAEIERLRKNFQLKYQQLEPDDKMCLVVCGKRNLCNDIISFINSLSEEPVSNSDWLTELQKKLDNATPEQLEELWNKYNGVDEEEPVSDDLEEAAKEHAVEIFRTTRDEFLAEKCKWSFKAGAQWQFNKLEKNRLAACNRATKEEIEREQDFCDKIIIGEHRWPTFSDAIEYGIKWQKEKTISKACEWLEENLLNYWSQAYTDNSDFIKDFRKSMED